jgi:hypothetical protein
MKKIILILILLPAWAWGASESHTAASWDTTNTGTAWGNPGNVTGSGDDACAYYEGTSQSLLIGHNFGFSSVTGTVDSINLAFDAYFGSAVEGNRDVNIQLTKTGGGANTPVGDAVVMVGWQSDPANCLGSYDTTIVGQDLWNTTWTPAEITASTFGVIMKDNDATNASFGFDAVTVTVYYTAASADKYWKILK